MIIAETIAEISKTIIEKLFIYNKVIFYLKFK
jgi:hypothetical protein